MEVKKEKSFFSFLGFANSFKLYVEHKYAGEKRRKINDEEIKKR